MINLKHCGREEAKDLIEQAITCFRQVTSVDGWKDMDIGDDDVLSEDEEMVEEVHLSSVN